MIQITKDEADYIRSKTDNVNIVTTARTKSKRQKKRYADESRETIRLLRKFHRKK